MQRFRNLSAPVAWLVLCAIFLSGELIATHSHDEPTRGKHSSVALSDGHALPDAAEHVESLPSIDIDLCPACIAAQRQGALAAAQTTSQSWGMVSLGDPMADGLAISGSDAQPPSPRGPPAV